MVTTNQAELSTIYPASPISPLTGGRNWSGRKDVSGQIVDTIAFCTETTQKEKAPFGKPVLPSPTKEKNSTDYLKILDEAYVAIFTEDSEGLQEQVDEEAQNQQLAQTMSKILLISTKKAVTEELKEATLITKAYKEEEHENQISRVMEDIFSFGIAPLLNVCGVSPDITKWVTLGVGITFAIAALAFTVATGGAGVEVEDAADAELAANIGSTTSDGIDVESEDGSVSDEEEISNSAEGNFSDVHADQGEGVANEQVEEELGKIEEEIDAENVTSTNKFRAAAGSFFKGLGKRVVGMTIAGVFQSSNLFQGIASLKLMGYKKQLADVQQALGPETANIGYNQTIFRFYQQLIQQSTNVIEGLGEQLGNVLQTYATINNDYRDISTGLTSAV
ncbi:MAG: hypothetical protein KDK55_03700 [Chlamydiia bacterium]|nr:hypothetical protein [Chlamydiia bacterium]